MRRSGGAELAPPPGLPPLTGEAQRDAAALCNALMTMRLPHRLGAAGPDAFDCWTMLCLLQHRLFAREVKIVSLPQAPRAAMAEAFASYRPAAEQWRAREGSPRHGDGVLMTHKDAPHHCGVFLDLDRGVVAHMAEHGGFSVDDRQALRLAGYTQLRFFQWASVRDCAPDLGLE
ncbi:hypothetical protein [Parvibaculum sp.]|uniref:hypothetical protein n=1 Tax=Parvibaculum sp. TaxID=2024848 RepID=UPI00391C860E